MDIGVSDALPLGIIMYAACKIRGQSNNLSKNYFSSSKYIQLFVTFAPYESLVHLLPETLRALMPCLEPTDLLHPDI
jgi:hypothetical protein